jgi:hypothetical protein
MDQDRFHIRPIADGARLPDPATGDNLQRVGEWKPRSPHWLRLELRGDVEQCDPPQDVRALAVDVYEAVHRGAGSYSVMRDGVELVEHLTKEEADDFNARDWAGQAAFLAEHTAA